MARIFFFFYKKQGWWVWIALRLLCSSSEMRLNRSVKTFFTMPSSVASSNNHILNSTLREERAGSMGSPWCSSVADCREVSIKEVRGLWMACQRRRNGHGICSFMPSGKRLRKHFSCQLWWECFIPGSCLHMNGSRALLLHSRLVFQNQFL